MKYLVIFCAALAAGCILPVSTGAPMPPTTVGKGRIGMAISGEAPTLDLIADNGAENMTGSPSAVTYGAAPAAAMTMTFSYGLGEHTDIEVAGEGALYWFIFPLPTGGSIGLRQHLGGGDAIDIGVAARIGQVSSSAEISSGGNTSESSATATYGAFQVMAQTKRGFVRPMAAVSFMPARISRDPSDEDPFKFKGLASSVTAGLMLVGDKVQVGPYLTATNFYSDRYNNSGWFVSGGLMLAFRPDRNREPAPPPPMGAPPAPGYGPPPMGPPPMGSPPMGPPPPMPPDPNAPPPPPPPTAAPM